MNMPKSLSADQLLDVLDVATNALEELAGRGNKIAITALDEVAKKTMAFMNGEVTAESE